MKTAATTTVETAAMTDVRSVLWHVLSRFCVLMRFPRTLDSCYAVFEPFHPPNNVQFPRIQKE
jgi:hypothetical protein